MTEHWVAAAGGVLGGALMVWILWNRQWELAEAVTRHA